jgi:chitin synthase
MQTPSASRPVTNYLDMPLPRTDSPLGGLGGPTDDEVERRVQSILRGADLATVTKREVRRQLEESFACDLSSRKTSINAMIDRALLSHS